MARNNYETIFIADPSLDEEGLNALTEKFKALIETQGEVSSVENWGKRKLAYEINYLTEGYYVLINFSAEADLPAELERVYSITDGIIRSLVVRKDA